jgi:hypothetical protein
VNYIQGHNQNNNAGHKNNRDYVTQTQAGFYKNKVVKIELPDND